MLFTNVVYQCCLQVLLFTSDVFFTDDLLYLTTSFPGYSVKRQVVVSPCGRKVQSTVNSLFRYAPPREDISITTSTRTVYMYCRWINSPLQVVVD